MRLPDEDGVALIHTALTAGARVLDTAHAYGNEARVAQAVTEWKGPRPLVVTKGGVHREGALWKNDARASTLRAQCEASLKVLGQIDLYLLHAPDPRVELATSVRALAKLQADGLVGAIGLSNVSLPQLREAMQLAPISAVQVALGAFHDAPFRDGLVTFCLREKIRVLAHSPLGGPKRKDAVAKHPTLLPIAARHGVGPGQIALSWLMDLGLTPLPGARRLETAAAIAPVTLTDEDRRALDARFTAAARAFRPPPAAPRREGELVLIMGIPGSGKTTRVKQFVDSGYLRLNRDERGGTMRGLKLELAAQLKAGVTRVVLDNTFVTRASRDEVLEVGRAHGLGVRCLWLDTPLADAQVNVIHRQLTVDGTMHPPKGLLPNAVSRMARTLEEPTADEGFDSLERVPFARNPRAGRPGLIVALENAGNKYETIPTLVIGWRVPSPPQIEGATVAVCPHEAGPPTCWCRPPLPGLAIAWAIEEGIDLTQTRVIGKSPTFKLLAEAIGAVFFDTT